MTSTIFDRPAPTEPERLIDRGIDAVRQVSHLSHEARLLTSAAADAVEDRVRAATRTAKAVRQDALDLRDDVTYRVKREPLKALAIAFAAGTLAGLLLAMFRPKRSDRHGGRDTEC